jgi:hypothetical protein
MNNTERSAAPPLQHVLPPDTHLPACSKAPMVGPGDPSGPAQHTPLHGMVPLVLSHTRARHDGGVCPSPHVIQHAVGAAPQLGGRLCCYEERHLSRRSHGGGGQSLLSNGSAPKPSDKGGGVSAHAGSGHNLCSRVVETPNQWPWQIRTHHIPQTPTQLQWLP